MVIQYDGKLDIATGTSSGAKKWKNHTTTWGWMVERLTQCTRTSETIKEYTAAPKTEKAVIKDVGGYVGAYLQNGSRSKTNVIHRQLITLDLDYSPLDFWDDYTMMFSNAAVLHSTHSHTQEAPRFRLIMPASREMSQDEYQAVARRIASNLYIDYFDDTTYDVNRLMFWPSVSKDVDYYIQVMDGPWVDVDAILASYHDWRDTSLWPMSSRVDRDLADRARKQQNPLEKNGSVGAFCRTYTIHEAIAEFLSDEYTPVDGGRYTYTRGTTSCGVVTYDDLYAYSHHGTDPISGQLCNAFDLVRIHKFGHMDRNTDVKNVVNLPSYKAMDEFARRQKGVRLTMASERLEEARYDFQAPLPPQDVPRGTEPQTQPPPGESADDFTWMEELDVDKNGAIKSTAPNLNIIFEKDRRIAKKFQYNEFDAKTYLTASMPWRVIERGGESLMNVDLSGIRNYIESIYGITGNLKIDDVVALQAFKNSTHPVRDYLNGLAWDGVPRVETLLIDYLGAADNVYTREATRVTLAAAVARVMVPGIKFDLSLTLCGVQGCGKSTLVDKLGREWYSDSFTTVQGKESYEQLRGAWIIEMAELSGLKRAEVESVKHFISKREDQYRPAFGRVVENFKRQNIFIGTTNKKDFLNDPTGSRRFMPVDLLIHTPKKNVFTDLEAEVDQVWAEAVLMFRSGQKLYLTGDAESIANEERESHSSKDEREGLVIEYLETVIPDNWTELDIFDRQAHLQGQDTIKGSKTMVRRTEVSVIEIWCEALGRDKKDIDRYKSKELNEMMHNIPGWTAVAKPKRIPIYGSQRYYSRV